MVTACTTPSKTATLLCHQHCTVCIGPNTADNTTHMRQGCSAVAVAPALSRTVGHTHLLSGSGPPAATTHQRATLASKGGCQRASRYLAQYHEEHMAAVPAVGVPVICHHTRPYSLPLPQVCVEAAGAAGRSLQRCEAMGLATHVMYCGKGHQTGCSSLQHTEGVCRSTSHAITSIHNRQVYPESLCSLYDVRRSGAIVGGTNHPTVNVCIH